jgi:hypothetical protein
VSEQPLGLPRLMAVILFGELCMLAGFALGRMVGWQ